MEKLSNESEEDLRLRRFIKLYTTHPSLWDRNEVAKWDLTSMLQTSCNRERKQIKHDGMSVSQNNFSSRYAEFYLGLSIIWFKTRCTNEQRNPIQVLLGEAEEGDTIQKLHGENEEDFRLRRFIESFKQLQVSSQEYIVKYILKTLLDNILEYCKFVPSADAAYASTYWFGERSMSNRSRRRSNRNYTRKSGDKSTVGSMICNNAQVKKSSNHRTTYNLRQTLLLHQIPTHAVASS